MKIISTNRRERDEMDLSKLSLTNLINVNSTNNEAQPTIRGTNRDNNGTNKTRNKKHIGDAKRNTERWPQSFPTPQLQYSLAEKDFTSFNRLSPFLQFVVLLFYFRLCVCVIFVKGDGVFRWVAAGTWVLGRRCLVVLWRSFLWEVAGSLGVGRCEAGGRWALREW